jgi:hypothetical protein
MIDIIDFIVEYYLPFGGGAIGIITIVAKYKKIKPLIDFILIKIGVFIKNKIKKNLKSHPIFTMKTDVYIHVNKLLNKLKMDSHKEKLIKILVDNKVKAMMNSLDFVIKDVDTWMNLNESEFQTYCFKTIMDSGKQEDIDVLHDVGLNFKGIDNARLLLGFLNKAGLDNSRTEVFLKLQESVSKIIQSRYYDNNSERMMAIYTKLYDMFIEGFEFMITEIDKLNIDKYIK